MKERPILFSAPMVRAILEGRKTQTRRIAKKMVRHPDFGNLYTPGALVLEHESQHVIDRCCPYGQPGDRLWVRETWCCVHGIPSSTGPHPDDFVRYRADDQPGDKVLSEKKCWKPSIHMPRVYSRILLEIIAVRVERLNSITVSDAIVEGYDGSVDSPADPSIKWFSNLWELINGAGSWAANPWVWVIEFKRVQP